LPRSKGDRNLEGRSYSCPALSRLCPVEAVEDWLALSKLKAGPLFRKIDRWGHLSEAELTPSSIIPMLRKLLSQAGVADAEAFSSHSLRRGLPSGQVERLGYPGVDELRRLARREGRHALSGWGQHGPESALRAGFGSDVAGNIGKASTPQLPAFRRSHRHRSRFPSIYLPSTAAAVVSPMPCATCKYLPCPFSGAAAGQDRRRYQISVPTPSADILDDHLYALLDELHRIADARECFLEAVCRDPSSGKHWD
jgi:hypothetical protein